MTTHTRHPHLFLSATAETQGNTPAAKPALPAPRAVGLSGADLLQEIESNPGAFDTDPEQKAAPAAPAGETAEQKTAREAKAAEAATAAAAAKLAADAKAKAVAGAPVELTADQTAWLERRAAATTAEEVAELDASAPVFTDEQWARVEEESQAQSAAPKAEDVAVTAQLTAAQAETARVKTEFEAASKRLKETEAELQLARTRPVAVAPMNPLMALDAGELASAEAGAAALKEWALKNWDGAPAVEAAGNQPAQPAYTAEQVRGAYARADKQLTSVIPAARHYLEQHEQENTQAREIYPELFTPSSPHAQNRESILRRLPGLRAALPQISTVIGDATLGETIRTLVFAKTPTAEGKALAAALIKADPSLAKFMPALAGAPAKASFRLPAKPIVPLARPGGGTPRRTATGGKGETSPSVKKFLKLKAANGGNEMEALAESLKDVVVN